MPICPLRDSYRGKADIEKGCAQQERLTSTRRRNFPIRRLTPYRVAV
jgi:hypothetical protein